MTADPLWFAIRENRAEALEAMSQGAGYHYDYGEIVRGGMAAFGFEADYERPRVFLRYLGEQGAAPLTGAERPYLLFTRNDVYEVSVAIKDMDEKDHELKAKRVQADIHAALMADRNCGAGSGVAGRPICYDLSDMQWQPNGKSEREIEGGVLKVRYGIRYEHITGDMSSADH